MVNEEGLTVSVPASSSVLKALKTQGRLELFMIQPESTQNEGKLSEKPKWILPTILGMWGMLSQLSYKRKKV